MARSVRVAAPGRLAGLVERIRSYLNEVWIELNRVDWPTRRELISSTIVVIVVLVVLAVYLGAIDYLYTVLIKRYLIPPRA
jgi:preprotein translocase subunit SecE